MNDFEFVSADDVELNHLLAGKYAGISSAWGTRIAPKIRAGDVGVIFEQSRVGNAVHPVMLVVKSEDQRKLFGRFAHLRSDLSPISTWCHVVDSPYAEALSSLERTVSYEGYEAAWTGVCIAEASLRASRPVAMLKLGACQSTESFVVARAAGLWGSGAVPEVKEKFADAHRLLRSGAPNNSPNLNIFEPIWSILTSCMGAAAQINRNSRPLVDAVVALVDSRKLSQGNEFPRFVEPLFKLVPELLPMQDLSELASEQRLRLFDRLLELIKKELIDDKHAERLIALSMVAGYVSTVAAGGAPSISLAEDSNVPEVMAWAYTLGGLGEFVFWTSSFDGLGRLVARELTRSFRASDPPTCDFSIDEARVLVDPSLKDSLVALRVKQARSVVVSLLPGVNLSLPLVEHLSSDRAEVGTTYGRQSNSARALTADSSFLGSFADAIWPYLEAKISSPKKTGMSASGSSSRGRPKRRNDHAGDVRQDTLLDKK